MIRQSGIWPDHSGKHGIILYKEDELTFLVAANSRHVPVRKDMMMILTRRALIECLGTLATAVLAAPVAHAQQTIASEPVANAKFGYSDVVRKARDLGMAGYDNTPPALPDALAKLDTDAYRDIRFRPEKALLNTPNSAFRAQMSHLGPLYKRAVTVNVIRDGVPTSVPYSAALFDYGKTKFERPLPVNLGFAGFRLSFPLNDPRAQDELVSFMGGNAFRLLGRNQRLGLSARGLTMGAGGTEPEELPHFREFWIEQPNNPDRVTLFALLDSPSATAAYQFIVYPATETVIEVTVTLFPRKALTRVGIAPLSSMFVAGENDQRISGDFRPERHDSDGLLMQTGAGEWIWRPLRNPAQQVMSGFLDTNPRGFGLMQRDRNFEHFQDLEQGYENRPSYWIEPRGDWGDGRIDLVERPASDESSSNITAFWTPRNPLEAGQNQTWSYRIRTTSAESKLHPAGRVFNTFVTTPPAREAAPAGTKRYIVDFTGGNLSYFFSAPDQVKLVANASAGKIVQTVLTPNPRIEGFRATLDIALLAGQSGDMQLHLKAGNRAVSESWNYPVSAD